MLGIIPGPCPLPPDGVPSGQRQGPSVRDPGLLSVAGQCHCSTVSRSTGPTQSVFIPETGLKTTPWRLGE